MVLVPSYFKSPYSKLVSNSFQNKVQSPINAANNPFLSTAAPQNNQQSIVDLFGPAPADTNSNSTKASDDLLGLGNPFSDMFGGKYSEIKCL